MSKRVHVSPLANTKAALILTLQELIRRSGSFCVCARAPTQKATPIVCVQTVAWCEPVNLNSSFRSRVPIMQPHSKAKMSAGTILRSSEVCDLGRVVGTMFETWFSAAAPNLLSAAGAARQTYHTHFSNDERRRKMATKLVCWP